MLTYAQKKIFKNNWKKLVKEGYTKDRPWLFVLYNYFIGRDICTGFSKNLHTCKFYFIFNTLTAIDVHHYWNTLKRNYVGNIYSEIYSKLLHRIEIVDNINCHSVFYDFIKNNEDFINIRNNR